MIKGIEYYASAGELLITGEYLGEIVIKLADYEDGPLFEKLQRFSEEEDKRSLMPQVGPLGYEPAEILMKTDSVEIASNAKGELSFKVKAYNEDVDDALASAVQAAGRAKERIANLKESFGE